MANSQKTGPGLAVSIIVLLVGTIAAVGGWYAGFYSVFSPAVNAPLFEVPGSYTEELSSGQYDVYLPQGGIGDIFSGNFEPADLGAEIVVTNTESGENIPTEQGALTGTTTQRGANVFVSVAQFKVDETAVYEVDVSSTTADRAIVGESFLTAWSNAIPWAILSIVGTILALAGFIMLVLGIIRRNRANQTSPLGAAGAPQVTNVNQSPGVFQAPTPPAPPAHAPPTSPGSPPPPPPNH